MSCIYFRSYGHWILDPHVPVHYLRAKGLYGYIILDYFNGTFTTYHLWTLITSWRWSHILLQVDITSTGRYYDDVDINQRNSYSRLVTYKSFQQDNFFVRCRHRPMFVNTMEHATHQSIYLIMLVPFIWLFFFLWHMCVMLYSVTCHRIL